MELTAQQRVLQVMAIFKEPVKVWVSKRLLDSMTSHRRSDAYDCIGVHSMKKILDKAGIKLGQYDKIAWDIRKGGIKFRDTDSIGECEPPVNVCFIAQDGICIPQITEPCHITIELRDCYV